jgi:hypothetical protein
MRATGVMRFVIFGAVGFGIGWAIAGTMLGAVGVDGGFAFATGAFFFMGTFPAYVFGGAIGGASLGLALKNRRKVADLALMSAVGMFFGSIIAFAIGLFVSNGEYAPLRAVGEAALGMALGAGIGLALGSWRATAISALAGFVGFGIGAMIATTLLGSQPPPALWQDVLVQAIEGLIGGASLGAALGYLESRKLSAQQRS